MALERALDRLGDTVKTSVKDLKVDRCNPKVKKTTFDGTGGSSFDDYEEFQKLFDDYTRNIGTNSKKIGNPSQLLEGTRQINISISITGRQL